jgi:putative ABC transport system permease protein
VAAGVGAWARLGQARAVVTATLRAIVQLLVVGAVIGVVFRTPGLAPLYLVVMLGAASWTSGRRLRGRYLPAALAVTAGATVTAVVVFGSGALNFDARTVVPLVAQLIGGSMTATTLSGQRLVDDTIRGWDEVEAWLALGATSREALRDRVQAATSRALVPALDQTRNVGLVVLPGAFVGLLLGGASPVTAGKVQLLVLVGLLASETVAAVTVTGILSLTLARTRPEP